MNIPTHQEHDIIVITMIIMYCLKYSSYVTPACEAVTSFAINL